MLIATRAKLCQLFAEQMPDLVKVNDDGNYEVPLARNDGTAEIDSSGNLKFFKKVEVLEHEQDYYDTIINRRFRDLRDRIATRNRLRKRVATAIGQTEVISE